jgi:hypothetical protein
MITVHSSHLKFVFALTLIAGTFLLTYNAYAQEAVSTTTESTPERPTNPRPEERQAIIQGREEVTTDIAEQIEDRQASTTERQEQRTERIEARQDIRTERQTALTEIRQTRILNLSANISNRMDAAIARLYAIVGRLETRIQKLTEAGFDTTTAATEVREAAEYLANAQVLMGEMDTLVFSATTSQAPLSAWNEVRSTYAEVARLIRASHQSLRDSITLIKTALSTGVTAPVEVPEETPVEGAVVSE